MQAIVLPLVVQHVILVVQDVKMPVERLVVQIVLLLALVLVQVDVMVIV